MPLSFTVMTTESADTWQPTTTLPPGGVYLMALPSRLFTTTASLSRSARIGAESGLTASVGVATTKFLAKIGLEGKGALFVSEGHQPNLHLSARNIAKADVSERRNLNAGSVLRHANLIFTRPALDAMVKELTAAKKESA